MVFAFIIVYFLLDLFFVGAQDAVKVAENVEAAITTSMNMTFYIEHQLTENVFTPRTKLQLITKSDSKTGILYMDKNSIVGENLIPFKKLVNEKGLYTIRIRSERPDWQGNFVLSSLPVCALQRSAFKEDIQAFLDANGNIIGVSYSVPPMTIAHDCDARKIKDSVTFQTRIRIGEEYKAQTIPLQVNGPIPPYLSGVKLYKDDANGQGGAGGEAGGDGQAPKNKSFFQRYWYIIMGLMIYMTVFGVGKEEKAVAAAPAKGAAGQGEGGAAAAPIGGRPATVNSSSSGDPSSSSSRSRTTSVPSSSSAGRASRANPTPAGGQ